MRQVWGNFSHRDESGVNHSHFHGGGSTEGHLVHQELSCTGRSWPAETMTSAELLGNQTIRKLIQASSATSRSEGKQVPTTANLATAGFPPLPTGMLSSVRPRVQAQLPEAGQKQEKREQSSTQRSVCR